MSNIGVIGLGRMGEPIVANLVAAGFEVTVWNRTVATAERCAAETGAVRASSPRELAERSDVVITMVSDDGASDAVHDGPDGVLAADGGAGHLVVMSTVSPQHVNALAARSGDRVVVDAPVSGSIDAARSARLLIMAGATDEALEPIGGVLAAIGRRVIALGTVGAGATMKLAINLVVHGLNQTVAESLVLAEAAGIEPEVAYTVLEDSAVAAPMLHYRKPQYLDGKASPVSFALRLAGKDLDLALELARSTGVDLPQTRLNGEQLAGATASGFGERDMAAVVDYLRVTHRKERS